MTELRSESCRVIRRFIALVAIAFIAGCTFDGGSAVGLDGGRISDALATGDAGSDAWELDSSGPRILTFRQGPNYGGTLDTTIGAPDPDLDRGADLLVHWEQDVDEFGLLRFDTIFGSAAEQIPFGASITQASLTLEVFDFTFTEAVISEVAIDWVESVTYNTFGNQAGVQAVDQHPETIVSIPTAIGTHVLDVTASLQRWSDAARVNRGWLISSSDANDQEIRSSEYVTVETERPTLMVEFNVP